MDSTATASEPTRREILRRTATAGGATLVGISALSERALAHECPRGWGFWATRNWCDISPVAASDSLQAKGLDCDQPETTTVALRHTGVEKTIAEWQAFLRQPTDEDAVTAMGQTFLATVLNFQLVSYPRLKSWACQWTPLLPSLGRRRGNRRSGSASLTLAHTDRVRLHSKTSAPSGVS